MNSWAPVLRAVMGMITTTPTNTTLAMVLEDACEAMAMVVVAFVTSCYAKHIVWSLCMAIFGVSGEA